MSKHHGDFNCLNCLSSSATQNKRDSNKKVCEHKDFCKIVTPSEDTKISEFNQYQKYDKAAFTYADFKCFDGCKNNTENSFTTKVGKHIPSGSSMSTISSFKRIKKAWCIQR